MHQWMLPILMLTAMVHSPIEPSLSILQEKARRAVKQLDDCLINSAERLRSSQTDWPQKYNSYRQSCSGERSKAFGLTLRYEWKRSTPRNADERFKAYRRATFRVDSRVDIWAARFLDPHPPLE